MTRAAALLALCVLFPAQMQGQEPSLLFKRLVVPAKDDKARGVGFVASVVPFGMQVLTEIEGAPEATLAFGDTDHDARNEIIKIADSSLCSYRIFEEQGNGVYASQYSGPCLYPMATGDLDEDGLSDLVGESGCCVRVYESPTPTTYPTQLVWTSPPLGNTIRETSVGDTDRDGRMEIVTSYDLYGNGSIFLIFENRGDNEYALVFADTIAYFGAVGNKAIGDLDGDRKHDIAISGTRGNVHVYEAIANDTWEQTWAMDTDTYNTYAVAIGPDTDANGRAELFVMGNRNDAIAGATWTTLVYESPSDNTFVEVAALTIDDGYLGGPYNAVVNLDGFEAQEYVMDTKAGLWVYRATAPGLWELAGHEPDPGSNRAHDGIFVFDLNQNGRPDLVWAGWPTTLVMEYRSGTSDVGYPGFGMLGSVTTVPNPAIVQAELRVGSHLDAETHVSVFDISGRLVERRLLVLGAQGQLLWPTRHLASGVYMLRLEGARGQLLATGKAIVAH